MSPPTLPEPLRPIADLLERTISIRHVYGEPITLGDRTVVPVAQLAFGFGGGRGGRRRGPREAGATNAAPDAGPEPGGAGNQSGGGGGVRLSPVGALELTPSGTRFIRYGARWRLAAAFALGAAVGAVVMLRARPARAPA